MADLLNNMIAFLSPKWAYEREMWSTLRQERRSYDGADNSRLNSRWNAFNDSAERTDRYSRDMLRARARDLERNSDFANSILHAFKRNVVGKGYSLQARTGDEELNRKIEDLWKQWTMKENCDITGTQSFNQLLRMAVVRKKVDGGMLFRMVYTDGGLMPFKLQALEVDELCTTCSVPQHKGNRVVGGVEYNSWNKPVGYWIEEYAIDGFQTNTPVYVPADQMIFYFQKHRPSQIREVSDMSTTITRIRDANEYMQAVSLKERIAACLAVFIRKLTGNSGLVGMGRSGSAADHEVKKSGYDGKMLTPGMINVLNPGEDVQVVDPKGSGDDANAYLRTQQRLMAAGNGLSYETTSRDMSMVNYSSARQGNIEDELTFDEERELLLENVLDVVYREFLRCAVLCGLLNVPDYFRSPTKYTRHDWTSSPKKWIDPVKEANAQKVALQYGVKTYKQISAEQGKDWQEQIDDMAEVKRYAAEHGVELFDLIGGKTNA